VYPAHQTIGLPSSLRQELHSPGKLHRYATLRGASTVETAAKIVETTTIEFGLRPEQQKYTPQACSFRIDRSLSRNLPFPAMGTSTQERVSFTKPRTLSLVALSR